MYYFWALTTELYGGKKQSTYMQQRKYESAFGCREEENKNNLRAAATENKTTFHCGASNTFRIHAFPVLHSKLDEK